MRGLAAAVGIGLIAASLLSGCGAQGAGGGGTPGGGTSGSAGSTPAGAGSAPAGLAGTTSLQGWTTGGSPSVDSSQGKPALMLPGDKSYIWQDLKKPLKTVSFDMNTQGLADFFFGCDANGHGFLFRVDTRGNENYSGFAATYDWTDWDAPGSGTVDVPAGTWVHVDLNLGTTDPTAVVSWGSSKETFHFNGQVDKLYPPGQGFSGDTTTFSSYKPVGTAFGFQGDGLGANSDTWVANLKVTV